MPFYVRTLLVTGPEEEVAPARREHERHVRDLASAGKIKAAGAFTRGDGYLEIFAAKDLFEAEAIARSSPLVEQGLGTWMLREWDELPV
jgi:uncharacterized protein YciI